VPKTSGTALRAILFTDIVGSTDLAHEQGDERWTRLLAAQRRIVREELKSHRGREVDTAGDGFFALFESPADAVRCAFGCARRVQDLGVDIRAGVHFGEIEMAGKDAHGIVVHTGARVMGQAGAAEVLATQTVRDLVAGATIRMEERGAFELKGVPGTWALFDVLTVDGADRPAPVDTVEGTERRARAARTGDQQRRRRWVVPTAAALVLAVAAVVAVRAIGREPLHVPPAGTVAMIDGQRFAEPVKVGSQPAALVEDGGTVWVADSQAQIYWVDGSSTSGSRGMDGPPTGLAAGDGSIWATAGFGSGGGPNAPVSRIDPGTHQPSFAFDTPIGARAVTTGGGGVWVASPDTGSVIRYDTLSRRTDSIDVAGTGAQPDPIAFDPGNGGDVWVGDSLAPKVYRISTATSHVDTYTIAGAASGIAVGQNVIWVSSAGSDAVYALDPTNGSVRTSVDVGGAGCNGPEALAVSARGVWVGCTQSQRVVLIDPARSAVTATLAVDGNPAALATAGDGSVWVAIGPR
jgi:class 3 adenylate cyclase